MREGPDHDPIIWKASPEVATALVTSAADAKLKGKGNGSGLNGKYKVSVAVKKTPEDARHDRYGGLARWNVAMRINIEQCKNLKLEHDDKTLDGILLDNEFAVDVLFYDWNGFKAPFKGDLRPVVDDTYSKVPGFHICTMGRWRTSLHTINTPFEDVYGDDLNALLRR